MTLALRQLWAIGLTTFREWIREKFFWVICALCVFLFLLSLVLGEMTFAERNKVLGDLSLLAMEISLCGLAAFAGSYLLSKEIDRQTCLLVLVRPLSRVQFFLGKWLGIASLLLLFLVPNILFLALLLNNYSTVNLLICGFSIFWKSLVVLSIVMAFSVFVRPLICLIFGISIYLLGHWLEDLKFFAEKSKDDGFIFLSKFADWIIPNFYKFNWKSYYFLENGVPANEIGLMFVHFLSWMVIYILIAGFLFRRKDIT